LRTGFRRDRTCRRSGGARCRDPELPHYRQIRNFTIIRDVFAPENGLLTANGKLRRDAINARYASEINAMYDSKGSREAVSRQHA